MSTFGSLARLHTNPYLGGFIRIFSWIGGGNEFQMDYGFADSYRFKRPEFRLRRANNWFFSASAWTPEPVSTEFDNRLVQFAGYPARHVIFRMNLDQEPIISDVCRSYRSCCTTLDAVSRNVSRSRLVIILLTIYGVICVVNAGKGRKICGHTAP